MVQVVWVLMRAITQVISQVDNKFIIVLSRDGVLLCVDQHAADERVQLEALEVLSGACT